MQRAILRPKPWPAQARLSELSWPNLSSLAAFSEGMTSNAQLPSRWHGELAAHVEYGRRLAQQAMAGQLRLADRSEASNFILRALNAMARWPFYDSDKNFEFVMDLGGSILNTLCGLSEHGSLTPAFVRALLRSGFLTSLSRQLAERAAVVRDRLCRDPHGNIAWGTSAGRVFLACLTACHGAASVLRVFETVCDGRSLGQHFGDAPGSLPPYAREAREAVVSSNLVEHACRGLLLLLQLPQALDRRMTQQRNAVSKVVLSVIDTSWAFEPPLYGPQPAAPAPGIWFPEPWHPQLHGPSCQHLTLALGLHVLRSASGPEQVYGLPGALEKALAEALGGALGEGVPLGEGRAEMLWLRDIPRHLLGLLAWHLETGSNRRGAPAAGGNGTAACGSPRAAGGTPHSLASAPSSAASAASGGAAASSAAAPGASAAAASAPSIPVAVGRGSAAASTAAAATAAPWPWSHAVRPRHVWDIAVRLVRMAVAAARAKDGDSGDGSGGGAQWQRSRKRFKGIDRGDVSALAMCGLGTLQLAIWRGGARQVQGHEGGVRHEAGGAASSGHHAGAMGRGQEAGSRELGGRQEQDRSNGRVQAEADVVRQDVRLLAEWYGLAMEVARYVVHVSGESHQLRLAAQVALQMPRMPEDPGTLPVRPPAKLRAALAGGYLPGLERLLRYVGQVPYNHAVIPVSRYLCYAASGEGYGVALGESGGAPAAPHSDLPWLVWYGTEPRHMASLLVTLGKLVTLMDVLATSAPAEHGIELNRPGGVTMVVPLCRALGGLRDCALVASGDVLRLCRSNDMLDAAVAGSAGSTEVGAGGGSGSGGGLAGGTSSMGEGGAGGGGSSSSSSRGGRRHGGGRSGAQRMHMAVFAISELLPRLAQGLNDALSWAAADGARRSSAPQATTVARDSPPLLLLSACLVPFLRAASVALHGWLHSFKAVCDAAGCEGSGAATATAAADSWRQLLLRDVGLPRVLAHVLHALPHLPEAMRAEASVLAVGLCSVLVETILQRGGAVSPPRGNVGQEGSAQLSCLWCPEKLLAAAGTAKVAGDHDRTWRRGVETALRISAWGSGEDVSGQQVEEAGPSDTWDAFLARAGEALPVCCQGGSLPSPAEAAAVVFPEPRCGFPGCINMEGDSEAGLRAGGLRACGRCSAVWYCSKNCQAAHWRAGHKQECGREQQQEQQRYIAGLGSGKAAGAPTLAQGAHAVPCGNPAVPVEEGRASSSSCSSSSLGPFFALLSDVVGGRTDAALARLRGPDGKTLAGAADTSGLTALHWTAAAGGAAVVAELLALGADVTAKSKAGTVARSVAIKHRNRDVACLIVTQESKGKGLPLGDRAQEVQRPLGSLGARLASGSTEG